MIRSNYTQREYEAALRKSHPDMDEFEVKTLGSKYAFLMRYPCLEIYDGFEPTLRALEGMVDVDEE